MSEVTPIRDPSNESLLTSQNAALAPIDYQPEQYTMATKSLNTNQCRPQPNCCFSRSKTSRSILSLSL